MNELPFSTTWQALTLPRARVGSVLARSNAVTYRVSVYRPEQAPPPTGFPTLYVLDADDLFVSSVELLRRAARRPGSTGVEPAVVIGIDRAARGPGRNEGRRQDYTAGPSANESLAGPSGGAAGFLDFLEDQLIPGLERELDLDAARRNLLGHSMAGYFTLWALVSRPSLFARFHAISPSIWWDPQALYWPLSRVPLVRTSPRVYLAAGQWEATPAPWQGAVAADPAAMARRRRRAMVERIREFGDALSERLPAGFVQFDLLPDEDHGSVVAPAIGRVLRRMHGPG